jgi:hypothetical protein
LAKFPKGFFGTIPDFDQGMEKTPDHGDLVEQSFPCILSGWPAIGIDGIRGIIGIDRWGFAGKDTIGFL